MSSLVETKEKIGYYFLPSMPSIQSYFVCIALIFFQLQLIIFLDGQLYSIHICQVCSKLFQYVGVVCLTMLGLFTMNDNLQSLHSKQQ
jgi:putative Mn2+ efflux pump MntP